MRSNDELGEPANAHGALRFLWIDAGQTAAILWLLGLAIEWSFSVEIGPLGLIGGVAAAFWTLGWIVLGRPIRNTARRMPPPP